MTADNVQLNPGVGGSIVRSFASPTDGVSQIQVVQQSFGGEGGESQVTLGNPLPTKATLVAQDAFGQVTVASRQPDFMCPFVGSGNLAAYATGTSSGSASALWSAGQLAVASGSAGPSAVLYSSIGLVNYIPGYEFYAIFTGAFSAGVSSGYQRIGLMDGAFQNGVWVGYEGTQLSITITSGGSLTGAYGSVAQASWNLDTLTGATGSLFTSAGTPVALVPSNLNVWRVRGGWVGGAPIIVEALSPDDVWVPVHIFRFTNAQVAPSLVTPNLPITVAISDPGSHNLTIKSSCWVAGSSSQYNSITSPLNSQSMVETVRAVLSGQTSAGAYTNVLTDTSGNLLLSPQTVISEANLSNAQSSDAPLFTAITGDPNGDFAGINLLEAVMNSNNDLGFNVRVQNAPKADAQGAQIPSDAPAVVSGTGTNATTNSTLFVIDTTGYQSLTLQLYGTWAGTVTFYGSNDGANWSVTTASGVGAAAAVTTATANNLYTIPVMGRFFKAQITAYTSGTVQALAYLRQQSTIPMAAGASVNLNQVGGASTVTAGVSGLLAVGGNVAAGVTATANPVLVGGVDTTGSTRRLLLDATGLLRVRQDIETQANESVVDLLTKILMELKLTNYRLGELPATLAQSTLMTTFAPPQTDDANVFLNDPQLLNQ